MMDRYLTLFFATAFLLGSAAAQDSAPSKDKERPAPAANPMGGEEGDKAELWRSLSEEDRKKLGEALREVWTDPSVIAAREEVRQATDSYSRAVKAAISKNDPSLVGLLTKLQKSKPGMGREKEGGRPGPGFGPPIRKITDQISLSPLLENLSEEERKRFRAAEQEARQSEAVEALREELNSFREQDDALRKKRVEVYRRLRQTMLREMVKIDPEIANLQKKLVFPKGPRPEGGPSKGGKGPKGGARKLP